MPKTIGIIGGRGQMGQLFAELFEQQGFQVLISDLDTQLSNQELAQKSDVVIISVPIEITPQVITEVAPLIRPDALLMDLTSIKKEPVKQMLKLSKAAVLGAHPLFGAGNGVQNQIIVLSPGRGKKWQNFIQTTFTKAGLIVKILDASEHDEIMAMVQGVSHFISIALAHSLSLNKKELQKFLEFQTPVYRITLDFLGRILNQDAALYASIQIENPLTPKHIQAFLNSGAELLRLIENKDQQAFIKFFEEGRKYLGDFAKQAQKESDEVINLFVQDRNSSVDFWKKQANKADLAILGPQNTYSHLATEKFFPQKSKIFCRTIPECFNLLTQKRVKAIFVPLENSIEGSVSTTLDQLFQSDFQIQELHKFQINHILAALQKTQKKNIKMIYSHAQALGQCQNFLKNNFPEVVLIPTSSTTEAISMLQNNHSAAICSRQAAEQSKLKIIQNKLQDNKQNETSFAFISHNGKAQNPKKVSLAFITKNEAGALLSVLQEFAQKNVNLTKIESRPNRARQGEFVFFVDLDGNLQEKRIQQTLRKIKSKTNLLKILGEW